MEVNSKGNSVIKIKFLSRSLQHSTWCNGLISSIFAHARFLPAVVSWTRTDLLSTFTHPRRVLIAGPREEYFLVHTPWSSHLPSTHAMLLQGIRVAPGLRSPKQLRIRKVVKKSFESPSLVNVVDVSRWIVGWYHCGIGEWIYILYLLLEKCMCLYLCVFFFYSGWKRFSFLS